jgi:LysR family glycine cleavage system transcriptional activator
MPATTHLKSLQALEMAIREGSLSAAARKLGITPAAVGQRIRSLENYLSTDLLLRGRSGLKPTPELERAMADLQSAFSALDRVTETLDFQRVTEIHIVADPDWSMQWLIPRLEQFQTENPNILFCVNGAGDVRMRLGAPDCRIEYGPDAQGEVLYNDYLLPVGNPSLFRRIGDRTAGQSMEGLPLLHLEAQRDRDDRLGWPDWFEHYGQRQDGLDRGVHYRHGRVAMDAVRQSVGFLFYGLSLFLDDLEGNDVGLPFPPEMSLRAPYPYRMQLHEEGAMRPQMQRFCDWLRTEIQSTTLRMEDMITR